MPAPQTVKDLVERFRLHKDAYKSGKYNEAQVRREFIDLFFEALGWDVHNKEGYAEAYKEVVHEDSRVTTTRRVHRRWRRYDDSGLALAAVLLPTNAPDHKWMVQSSRPATTLDGNRWFDGLMA